jgi:hypothetical protein
MFRALLAYLQEALHKRHLVDCVSGVPRNFFGVGGGSQIQLRTEGGENGNLGALTP